MHDGQIGIGIAPITLAEMGQGEAQRDQGALGVARVAGRIEQAGANGSLVKPFTAETLSDRIARVMGA